MSDDVICNRDYCDITCIGGHVNDVATFLKNQSDSVSNFLLISNWSSSKFSLPGVAMLYQQQVNHLWN